MTGDSDKEFGDPGEQPASDAIPPSEGDISYRPLRGWASAYDAEPTLWARFASSFGRLFSRKPVSDEAPTEIDQVADAARELEQEQAAFSATPLEDSAFFMPDADPSPATSEEAPRPDAETVESEEEEDDSDSPAPDAIPLRRDYQLRGEPVADIPVVRDYQFHSAGDDDPPADSPDASAERSSLEDAAARREKPGQTSESSPRLDRPSLEFFMRVDRAPGADAPEGPSLDDVLPMEDVTSIEESGIDVAPNPTLRRPSPSWTPVIPPAHDTETPGFFSRLLSRISKSHRVQPEPAFEASETTSAPTDAGESEPAVAEQSEWAAPQPDAGALEAAEQALTSFAEPLAEPVSESFATVDDALPPTEDFSDFAPPLSDPSPTPPAAPRSPPSDPFATTLPTDPPPPPESEVSFDTQQMEPVVLPPALVTAGQSPSALQAMEDVDTDRGSMVLPVPPEVTAAQEAERPPFFVPKFRSFYNEIVSHKHQKAEFTAGFATAVMDYSADLTPDAAAAALSKRLREILELQAAEATWMGGEAAARFPDAQYAMAALADEVFTYLEWPGKEAWPRHLVEQQLFRSNAKDVEFFKRVDRLLKNESDDPSPAAKDLARMYLLVLAAGFQGKYRPFGLSRPLAEYRRRLYEFIARKDPLLLYGEQRKLFPEAAEHVVVGRAVSRFSMLQQWAAVLVIIVIGYAVISHLAWSRVSADLKDVTARVEAANTMSNSDGVSGDSR